MAESSEVVKVRMYKGKSRQLLKFTLKANKIQEGRFIGWIKDNASDFKSDL